MQMERPYFYACPRCASRDSFTRLHISSIVSIIIAPSLAYTISITTGGVQGFSLGRSYWVNLLVVILIQSMAVAGANQASRQVHCNACGEEFNHPPIPYSARHNWWWTRFGFLAGLTIVGLFVVWVSWLMKISLPTWFGLLLVPLGTLVASVCFFVKASRIAEQDRLKLGESFRFVAQDLPTEAERARKIYEQDQAACVEPRDYYFGCPRCASRRSFSKLAARRSNAWAIALFLVALAICLWLFDVAGLVFGVLISVVLCGVVSTWKQIRCNACLHAFRQPLAQPSPATMHWRRVVAILMSVAISVILLLLVLALAGMGKLAILSVPLVFFIFIGMLVCYSKAQAFQEVDRTKLAGDFRVSVPDDMLYPSASKHHAPSSQSVPT